MEMHKQNRNNKQREIERINWFIERIQMHLAFNWLRDRLGGKLHARELSRNQPILCFDIIRQHDWPIEQ